MSEFYKGMTAKQWAEEYEQLERRFNKLSEYYAGLHEAAESAWACALPPGVCKPSHKGESGEYRQFVATDALNKLNDALWPEISGE